jgi:hypothetical protein
MLRGLDEPDLSIAPPHRHPAMLRGLDEPDLSIAPPHRHPAMLRGLDEPDLSWRTGATAAGGGASRCSRSSVCSSRRRSSPR